MVGGAVVGGAVGGVFAAILMLLVVGVIIALVVFVTRRRKRADNNNNTISNAIYDGKNFNFILMYMYRLFHNHKGCMGYITRARGAQARGRE